MTKCYTKVCKNCMSRNTKKDWSRRWKQSYKCKDCNYVWISVSRKKDIDTRKLYHDYSVHKQTYSELWTMKWISKKTIQRKLDSFILPNKVIEGREEIVLLIDTTYFGNMWLMVFKEVRWKMILHFEIVNYETNNWYKNWIRKLQEQWWIIKAIVCDWRRWLLWWFADIPTQMCQFHQQQIVRRYITKKPVLEANKELKVIVDWLHRCDEWAFRIDLERWYKKHESFLKEQWTKSNWKKYYIHKRTRCAYYSLKRNLEYLFIYERYWWELDIPNTTNGLEAVFSHLKYKVNLHRWLRQDRKIKLISYLLQH